MDTAYSWYLACHKRGKKNFLKVQIGLEYMGVSSFTPLIYVDKERSDRKGRYRIYVESLFPGYFFLNLNPAKQNIQAIGSIPGFSHFIRFGVDIKPLRDEVVKQIMSLPQCSMSEDGGKKIKTEVIDEELLSISRICDKEQRVARFCEFIQTS